MGDSFEYIYEAINIKSHLFFYSGNPALPIEPEYMTQRQPVYPLFLLGVYLFAINNWIVLVLQNILSIINICYFRKMLGRLGYNKKYDWLLLLLIIAYPAQFINANTIAPDILLQSCTLAYCGCFIALMQTRQLKYAWLSSIALVIGLLVKPVLYPFVFIHLLAIIAVNYKFFSAKLLLSALLPVLAVATYNYSNYTRTGKCHFSSNQSFNAIFYYYGYVAQREGADSASHFLHNERTAMERYTVYKDRYNYANDRGMQLLRQNLLPYIAYHLKNTARIFIEPGKGEMDLFTGRLTYGRLYSANQPGFYAMLKSEGVAGMPRYIAANPSMFFIVLVLLFNIIRLAGLALFFFNPATDIRIRLFIFMVLSYFAVAAGPIANTRYFLPVSLLAIGCSVLGFQQFTEKRKLSHK